MQILINLRKCITKVFLRLFTCLLFVLAANKAIIFLTLKQILAAKRKFYVSQSDYTFAIMKL